MRDFKVYAVDFDRTLCQSNYPYTGELNMYLINFLLMKQRQGDKIILWTCRSGEELQVAVDWCKKHRLTFDAINDNLEELKAEWGNNPRKIAADYYIDDKACISHVFNLPF